MCLEADLISAGQPPLDLIDFFSKMVGDPGIEPGMSHLGGVTVRCRTLQPVAQQLTRDNPHSTFRQHKIY